CEPDDQDHEHRGSASPRGARALREGSPQRTKPRRAICGAFRLLVVPGVQPARLFLLAAAGRVRRHRANRIVEASEIAKDLAEHGEFLATGWRLAVHEIHDLAVFKSVI